MVSYSLAEWCLGRPVYHGFGYLLGTGFDEFLGHFGCIFDMFAQLVHPCEVHGLLRRVCAGRGCRVHVFRFSVSVMNSLPDFQSPRVVVCDAG